MTIQTADEVFDQAINKMTTLSAAVAVDEEYFDTPTKEEKVFRAAKRVCVFLAGIALTFSVLDILEIRSLGEVHSMWQARLKPAIASVLASADSEVQRIAFLPPEDRPASLQGTVSIPAIKNTERAAISEPVALPKRKAFVEPERPLVNVALRDPSPAASFLQSDAPIFAALPERDTAGTFDPAPASKQAAVSILNPVPAAAPDFVSPQQPALPVLSAIPLPRPSPNREEADNTPKEPTPADRLGLNADPKLRAKHEKCLANAVYFESRSEPLRGQIAVAQVVMNRVFSPFYPKDICSVVYQNAHRRLACQFTFACDGKSKAIHDRGSWARANRIAKQTLDGKLWVNEVAKSTHYHAQYVKPNWIREMRRNFKTGLHMFYRPYNWGDGSDEPGWVKLPQTAAKDALGGKSTKSASAQ